MKKINEAVKKVERPIKAIQFGEGNFLRAFVDWVIDILNEKTDFNGNVVMVQPIPQGLGEMINDQDGLYTTILRGLEKGERVEEFRTITSTEKCINPYTSYDEYMALSTLDTLRYAFSNTTEAGISYSPESLDQKPQVSFPGKITAFLYNRFKHFNGDMSKGLIFIPCELIDKNGDTLKEIVLRHANEWNLGDEFISWVNGACDFCNSLVDRIVTGYPRSEADEICTKLGFKDNLLAAAEIFFLWVIECHNKYYNDELKTGETGINVVWTDDMSFYRTRKVRILNGAHTAMVLGAYLAGMNTVEDCLKDETISSFLKNVLFEEIIPSMDGDQKALEEYAASVLDRFANPYIVHLLLSISLNSVSKFKTRDLPSLLSYIEKKGELPKYLSFSLASLIAFYNGTNMEGAALRGDRNGELYFINDSSDVLEVFASLYNNDYPTKKAKALEIASSVLAKTEWWGQDLTKINGLTDKVALYLEGIWTNGVKETINNL